MKAHAFSFERPLDVAGASRLLAEAKGEGRVLAGGQTLGPMLNMRLAMPKLIVDIGNIAELKSINHFSDRIVVGACVNHATLEDWIDLTPLGRLLSHAGGSIAYRAIRNRGTIGGSLCHADPAADWVTTMSLLQASLLTASTKGKRRLVMSDFMLGTYSTALNSDEMLVAIDIPKISSEARWGYYRVCRKVGEFPEALGAVLLDAPRSVARVIAGGMNGKPANLTSISEFVAATGKTPELGQIESEIGQIEPEFDAIDLRHHAVAVRRAIQMALL
ncbi:MAG: FAD binding domain-containing protein [Xanthobacteraceae bacterium]|nr:FAD binding domain-containing protein [Xanthobacteraceae bacterium]MBX3533432.1 FAD binding domain-containing protein [Xanthobacteraceae bacterium]MCW5676372.1 FAD binding domain-containing protein [Xanthobacteraceae bacterium]